MPLNTNQRKFIALYRAKAPRNATRAYEQVYTARGHVAEQAASRLLRNVEVEAAIAEADAADLRDLGITAAAVLRGIAQNAFSDVRELYDEQGALLPVHALGDDIAMAVAGIAVVETMERGPDGEPTGQRTSKVRLWNKTESLKTLAQYLKLLTETVKVEHTGEVLHTWSERLTHAHTSLEERRNGLSGGSDTLQQEWH
jgi:phage terminase small subunit